jgi:hypothetical protein
MKPDDKGRPTVQYFFSDMLHVTAELNMADSIGFRGW